MSSANRKKLYQLMIKRNQKVFLYEDIVWFTYNGIIQPMEPCYNDLSINYNFARQLMKELGAYIVRTTGGFNNSYKTSWYSVICDSFLDISQMNSKNRTKLRYGLKNCRVERIIPELLAEVGYDVFISAHKRYKNNDRIAISKNDFSNRIISAVDFEDIIDYWGVYYQDKLIAYSENFLYEQTEVNYSTTKFDPEYLRFRPSEALFYKMNEYYLSACKFKYVNDGYRSILHQSNIQNFLIEKFNFKKQYMPLYIFYHPFLKAFVSSTYPFRKLFQSINTKLKSLYLLESIRREIQDI